VFEVVGDVLLIDDNAKDNDSRDQFYRDALDTYLPGGYSVWNITDGLPEREEDVRLTLAQFNLLIWYTGNGESAYLPGIQGILTDFVEGDFDPDTPGVQSGQLFLEMPILAGNKSSLSNGFRAGVLGINSITDPRNPLESYFRAQSTIGDLEITAQVAPLPDLLGVGENYLMDGSGGIYFDLVGLVPEPDAAALWKFEQYIWGGDRDTTCRAPGCEPVVAVRRPATGVAKVVSLGFQLEYANASGTAIDAVGTLLRDHLGRNVATP